MQYRERLPEKLAYLADAPQKDPEENEAIVRFSRKEKKQYVTSEKREKRRNGLLISPMENGLNERNKKKKCGKITALLFVINFIMFCRLSED